MSKKSRNRFNLPQYSSAGGLNNDFLKHIWDFIDGHGMVSESIRDALLNDALASSAWQRNEVSADNAAQRQIDATRELRQTQHEDLVASSQAAGINPYFALSGGVMSGTASAPQASAPSGTTSSGSPRVTLDSLLNIFQTGIMAMKTRAEVNSLNADARNKDADTDKTRIESQYIGMQMSWFPKLQQSTIDQINAGIRGTESQIDLNEAKASHERVLTVMDKIDADFREKMNNADLRLKENQADAAKAEEAASLAKAALDRFEKHYIETYGSRPGTNDMVAAVAFICSALGIDHKDTISSLTDKAKEDIDVRETYKPKLDRYVKDHPKDKYAYQRWLSGDYGFLEGY